MKKRAGSTIALYQERRNVFQKKPLVPGFIKNVQGFRPDYWNKTKRG
jgi:hypothetical protein